MAHDYLQVHECSVGRLVSGIAVVFDRAPWASRSSEDVGHRDDHQAGIPAVEGGLAKACGKDRF